MATTGPLKINQRFDVDVTGESITAGEPLDVKKCMLAQAMRLDTELAAWSISFAGKDGGVAFPEVRFSLTDKQGQKWRYHAMLSGEAAKAEELFDTSKRPKPFSARLRIIHARRVRRIGSRAERGLPPKAAPKRKKTCVRQCMRRYHQISVATETH